MKLGWASLAALIVIIAFVVGGYLLSDHGAQGPSLDTPQLWRLASPGSLTGPHAFLAHRCESCHQPYVGVTATACIVCHANEQELLARQPTAFHADVGDCVPCHLEHDGIGQLLAPMDHSQLAEIGLRQLSTQTGPDDEGRLAGARIEHWLEGGTRAHELELVNQTLLPEELALDCSTCHQNDDRHFNLFGSSCSDCHGTAAWSLPEFRHPTSASRDCAQCHQAPPSHYMGHFRMISQGVAGQHDARVDQCFECHQTTSWIDIRRVGMYQHH